MPSMVYPKEKKKQPRKSIPLKRSIHINGKRWGWEYEVNKTVGCGLPLSHCKTCDEHCRENEKIKILSPDNKYHEIMVEDFNDCFVEEFQVPDWSSTNFERDESGRLKYPIAERTITLRRIKPNMVKKYIVDNLINGV